MNPLIFTRTIKLNSCVNLQFMICYRNSFTYNWNKYKSISVLVEESAYLTTEEALVRLSQEADMGSVALR